MFERDGSGAAVGIALYLTSCRNLDQYMARLRDRQGRGRDEMPKDSRKEVLARADGVGKTRCKVNRPGPLRVFA